MRAVEVALLRYKIRPETTATASTRLVTTRNNPAAVTALTNNPYSTHNTSNSITTIRRSSSTVRYNIRWRCCYRPILLLLWIVGIDINNMCTSSTTQVLLQLQLTRHCHSLMQINIHIHVQITQQWYYYYYFKMNTTQARL